ncbi:Cytosolic carboxypeptidase 1 [Toxocara canis]|uniref:Cytosolic carboxypeptidase 1 n=1 Tax=Toxocara canis TaxID=6265 RepID=A0A0B2VAB6_TOXCA|nr:Cytosolic carboxypeptidase 1 [Toxocara canis]
MYAASYDVDSVHVSPSLGVEESQLTNLFLLLIDEANSRAEVSVQRQIAQLINDLFGTETEQHASTYRFLLCVKTKSSRALLGAEVGASGVEGDDRGQDDIMIRLLKAVEFTSDDLAKIMLCRLLGGYMSHCKPAAAQRRQRRLLRLDGANFVMRALVTALKDPSQTSMHLVAVDALAAVLLAISAKDRKFTLKARLVGLIGALHSRLFASEELCTLTLLRLMCRCVRSSRNAQLLGRCRHFSTEIVARIGDASSAMGELSSLKLARLTEILYFVSKNKKCKSALLDEMAVPVVKRLFERQFEMRLSDTNHLELCLISLACLRQFSKMNRGRDQLISEGVLEMCEHAIDSVANDRHTLSPHSSILAPFLQLQDSLCSLCMRCLPVEPFPLCSSSLPISFTLPSTRSPLTVRRSASKSPSKSTRVPATAAVLSDILLDTAPSSDEEGEEEEEESFLRVGLDRDIEVLSEGGDDDDVVHALAASAKPLSFSRQKCAQLSANYTRFFNEYFHAACYPQSPGKSSTCKTRSPPSYSELITAKVQQTKSVIRFVKIAFPESIDANIEVGLQPIQHSDDCMREMVMQEMSRSKRHSEFVPRIVFDLDRLLESDTTTAKNAVKNNDKRRIGKLEPVDHLLFESRFESGNLRRVTQVGSRHYELILSPDINQSRAHYQWFYFEVSNNEANVPYTFEVVNCIKSTSMFSKGMQPVLFSVTEASRGRPGWVRAGSSVCYYRNLYANTSTATRNNSNKKNGISRKKKGSSSSTRSFFSIRFTITFQHAADICYIAYHFPYTYSFLQASLEYMTGRLSKADSAYMRVDKLCDTLAGNAVPLITITATGSREEVDRREVVVLSARVHPGESNASWMMHGVIEFLLGSSANATELRDNFVFKLIPMLNPDGVINGSHRCSLAGVDLNRVWDRPSPLLHPSVFHAKGVIQYVVDVLKKKPFVFVDFHGHSRRCNVFVFGNNPEESWRISDRSLEHDSQFMLLPELLDQSSRLFSLGECRFSITKAKEPSARVVIWRQFDIRRVYTMEATYCGFDVGPYAGNHVGISELKEMGRDLCMVLLPLKSRVDASTKKTQSERRRAKSESGSASELLSSS